MPEHRKDFSMEDIIKLYNSPAGQQLIALLQNTDSSLFQQASEKVNAGNFDEAGKSLSALTDSPQIQALLKELGKQL